MLLFWLSSVGLVIVSLAFVAVPLMRTDYLLTLVLGVIISAASFALYKHWGNPDYLQAQLQARQTAQAVQHMQTVLKRPGQVIARMEKVLSEHPNSAKGFYLLGRLYMSENHYGKAQQAFSRANRLWPKQVKILQQLIQARYFNQHMTLDEHTKLLIEQIFKIDSQNQSTLSLMAIDAYRHAHYNRAISIWEQMLKQVSEQSSREALLSAIADAQKALVKRRTD